MRTSTLQYLYLQKPITMTVIICMISVLPWLGFSDFSRGEANEAAIATTMLESSDFIIPQTATGEFIYEPPMTHWLMALFSLPQGYLSVYTSRLPSAIAFIVLVGFVLMFFGKRIAKFQEAFIATLFLITCTLIHKEAMMTHTYMLLTTFIVLGLFQLFRWEDKLELKGLPPIIPILLGCAVLTKGVIGMALPLFVFGIYLLMLRKYKLLTVFKALFYMAISSSFLPLLWYVAVWQQKGAGFVDIVFAKDFFYFFNLNGIIPEYNFGYCIGNLLASFIPWTLFFLFSLFGLTLHVPEKSIKEILKDAWRQVLSLEKVRLFSLVAVVCMLFFYFIPGNKQNVYLMSAYPFIALFLAQYALYLTEYRTKVTRVYAIFIAGASLIGLIVIVLTALKAIDPVATISQHTNNQSIIHIIQLVCYKFVSPSLLTILLIVIIASSVIAVFYQIFKKINIKILYTTILLTFTLNLFIDGVIIPSIRNKNPNRSIPLAISKESPSDKEYNKTFETTSVVNN